MSDRSRGTAARGPTWLNRQLVVPGVLALLAAFYLAAATTLHLRGGGAGGFPAQGVAWLQDRFGFEPTFMVAALVLVWCSIWFLTGRIDRPLSRVARIVGLGFCLAVLIGLRGDGVAGGSIGAALAARLTTVLSPTFAVLLVGGAVVAALLLATDFLFFGDFKRLADRAASPGGKLREPPRTPGGGTPRAESVRTLDEEARARAATAGPDPDRDDDESGVEAAAVAELESLHLGVAAPDPIEGTATEDGAAWFEAEAWAHPGPDPDAVSVEPELEPEPAAPPPATDFDLFGDPVVAPADPEPVAEFAEESTEESTEEFDFEIPFPLPPEAALEAPDHAADAVDDETFERETFEREAFESEADAEWGTDAGRALESEPETDPGTVAAEPIYTIEPTPPPALDEELVSDARDLVVRFRRASANFLSRRLRVRQVEALAIMQELRRRGVIECDADGVHGRVLADH